MSTAKYEKMYKKGSGGGKTKNPKYVDLLTEDKPIAGQAYACLSFVAPEQIIKKKEMFFFEQFAKKWDLNKSMEKFIQFLNFVSYKYNVPSDALMEDYKEFVETERANLATANNFEDDYKNFLDANEDRLQKQFDIEHDFQTNTRGFKVRGVYPTEEEARMRCKMLAEVDRAHDIGVHPVGVWGIMNPDAYKTGNVEYLEDELNHLMHEKMKNEAKAKAHFDQRVQETKKKAIDENMRAAEKSGNVLTQTLDDRGNLVGVNSNNANNTREMAFAETHASTSADIQATLFEGENVVTGQTDHGQSRLLSGPFAGKTPAPAGPADESAAEGKTPAPQGPAEESA